MSRDPSPLAPGTMVGVTEDMIRDLVHAFYAKVRLDPVLGPIFNRAVHDWDAHLEKLCGFWSSVMLMTGRYKGTPMKVHADVDDIERAHFAHWLGLFRETARDICPPAAADLFIDRAERIAQSLEMGISIHRGWSPGLQMRIVGVPTTAKD